METDRQVDDEQLDDRLGETPLEQRIIAGLVIVIVVLLISLLYYPLVG